MNTCSRLSTETTFTGFITTQMTESPAAANTHNYQLLIKAAQ